VKPDNIIVTDRGTRLVDLGLLTPLASALTLTTHGTEYFRDPEMVRLAVKGKRVKDVEAVRFDIYSAGAVMYLLLDGSFPACGPLSRISRPVPMALSWITSRAMAEGDKRYPTVAAMRADLEAVIARAEEGGFEAIPVSALPSFAGFDGAAGPTPPEPFEVGRSTPRMAPPRLVPVHDDPGYASRRASGSGALIIGGIVAFVLVCVAGLLSVFVFASGGSEPRPENQAEPYPLIPQRPRMSAGPDEPRPPEGTPAGLVDAIEEWRGRLERQIRQEGSLTKVPLLLVGDETLPVKGLIAGIKEECAKRAILFHPSTALAYKVAVALRPETTAREIRDLLLLETGGDTLPMVLWVRDLGYLSNRGGRTIEVVGFYGSSRTSYLFSAPGTGGKR
jgi:hypothetical protein